MELPIRDLSNPELLVGLAVAVAVVALGGALLLVLGWREERRAARQRALGEFKEQRGQREEERLAQAVNRVGEAVSGGGGTSPTLREELARAGYHSPNAATLYIGYKIVGFALGLLGASVLLLPLALPFLAKVLLIVLLATLLFFVPNVVVATRRGKRREELKNHLPDAVDLLEICVSAGMGLDTAWNAVTDEIRRVSNSLADEMELTTLEISLGSGRSAAMRNMAVRTGAEEISSLVALLVQSERFGASIVEGLRVYARSLRETRTQRAEEHAEKMSVRLLFPMVIFIFPPLLIVMVGPAMVELLSVI